jgi:hypothetical protein
VLLFREDPGAHGRSTSPLTVGLWPGGSMTCQLPGPTEISGGRALKRCPHEGTSRGRNAPQVASSPRGVGWLPEARRAKQRGHRGPTPSTGSEQGETFAQAPDTIRDFTTKAIAERSVPRQTGERCCLAALSRKLTSKASSASVYRIGMGSWQIMAPPGQSPTVAGVFWACLRELANGNRSLMVTRQGAHHEPERRV